ncbi:MAG: DUF3576 domain-containing protein [Alphaproteobacteria bacterium]|nr:DUF3576 domain-containing protein [Alphaproteobacteria bacterium]
MVSWIGGLRAARTWLIALSGVALLAACGDADLAGTAGPDPKYSNNKKARDPVYKQSVFGEDGLSLGGSSGPVGQEGATGLGVNTFLWRATLDTLSFMPLSSADPFGGVIITDWYAPPDAPGERFKATAYILDRTLRSDGIRVALFRQVRGLAGDWIDAPTNPRTSTDLEEKILERARQLKISSVGE